MCLATPPITRENAYAKTTRSHADRPDILLLVDIVSIIGIPRLALEDSHDIIPNEGQRFIERLESTSSSRRRRKKGRRVGRLLLGLPSMSQERRRTGLRCALHLYRSAVARCRKQDSGTRARLRDRPGAL